MKMLRMAVIAVIFFLAMSSFAYADSLPTLTLIPSDGAITGPQGSTVGWGFTLTNLGSNFAVVSSSDFCVGVITSPCSNSLGTYTDFSQFQFVLVGPDPESNSVTQSFDNTLQTGIGSFLINPGAMGTVMGEIVLTYDLYTVDPNSMEFNPEQDTFSVGNYLTASASVTVGTQTTATPEPGTLVLLGSGLTACLLALKKRT